MIVVCDSNDCKYCMDGECTRECIEITSSGFLPTCQDYEESDEPIEE